MVHRRRMAIYIASMALGIFSFGNKEFFKLRSVSFMVDDVPEQSQVKKDLKFFEANFSGIMPLEMTVEFISKKRRPLDSLKNFRKAQ